MLTVLDEVELQGSRATLFDVAEVAGYALQSVRLAALAVALAAAHAPDAGGAAKAAAAHKIPSQK